MNLKFFSMRVLLLVSITFALACTNRVDNTPVPFSDQNNEGCWELNTAVSDEFDSTAIDEERWYIVGAFVDGKPIYKHPDKPKKKVWTGRAPSQFSGRNYRLEDGMLKLETRWEPDFPFIEEIHQPVFGDALPYENITTACFIARKSFKYGYVEIRSKAADTQVTSAFWSMGERLEFDFFEMYGDGRGKGKEHLDSQLWWSIRDWGKLRGKPSYTEKKDMGFRGSDDFHIYGVEWSEEGIKYFIDGKLFSDVSADSMSVWAQDNLEVAEDYDAFVATKEISIWLDNEIFPWHGIPQSKEELTQNGTPAQKAGAYMDYEIDYVRVWQKKTK